MKEGEKEVDKCVHSHSPPAGCVAKPLLQKIYLCVRHDI